MKKIPRVRESCVKKFPCVTKVGGTGLCMCQNGALRSRGDGELQILKAKAAGFCSYENGCRILPIFRLFDQTPYFRVKRFLQTVFGNVLVGSYFVQRNRNIAAAATSGSELEKWYPSDSEKWSPNFFREPQTHMYRSIQLDLFFTFASTTVNHTHCKGSAFARCNKELEPGEILIQRY